jgi:hypothetical protein
MKTRWTQGLDETLSQDVRGDFKSSLVTRKRLAALLEEDVRSAEKTALNKDGYDVANWALKQADLIGYKRALQHVINLIIED